MALLLQLLLATALSYPTRSMLSTIEQEGLNDPIHLLLSEQTAQCSVGTLLEMLVRHNSEYYSPPVW